MAIITSFILVLVCKLVQELKSVKWDLERVECQMVKVEENMSDLTVKTKLSNGSTRGKVEELMQKIKEQSENIQALGYEINGVRELIDAKSKELDKTVKTECGRILFTPLKIKYEDKVV